MNKYYNPRTKQIMGCKRGTLDWYHESRHAWQDKKGLLDLMLFLRKWLIVAGILFWLLADYDHFFWLCTGACIVGSLLPEGFVEFDAWLYAVRRKWF